MRITELTSTHLPALLSLLSGMPYDVRLDLNWLRYHTLDDPSCLPGLLLVAEIDGEVAGFVIGALRAGRGNIKLFGVGKGYRRQGIATALFEALEARLCTHGAGEVVVGALGPNFFEPAVNLHCTDAVSFLFHRGYQTDRVARVNMAVDLRQTNLDSSAAVELLAPQGVTLRRAEPEEIPMVARFARTHFSEGWGFEVSEAARFQPVPLFIAVDAALPESDCVVSFAAYDVGGAALFGPTGTRPDYRRRGIGSALLKMCLHSLRQRGEGLAEIGWAGPVEFYAREVDARIHKVYWVFTKTLR